MKKVKVTFLIAILGMFGALNLDAHDFQTPHISVSGEATKSVKPDQLTWRISIRNEAKNSKRVASAHNESVARVVKLLRKHGVKKKDIQTTHMQLSENKQYRKNEWLKLGFFASSQINFKLTDLKKYKALWDGLAEFSEVSSNGFSYSHSDAEKIKSELRNEALVNAKVKAMSMAKVLSMRAGKPLVINETSASPSPVRAERMMTAQGMKGQENISVGRIEYRMNVSVVFEMTER